MDTILPRYLKYFSIVIMIFGILYKYEIPPAKDSSDRKTFLLTKKSTLQYNRSYVYKIITNIDKYPVVCYLKELQNYFLFYRPILYSGIQM